MHRTLLIYFQATRVTGSMKEFGMYVTTEKAAHHQPPIHLDNVVKSPTWPMNKKKTTAARHNVERQPKRLIGCDITKRQTRNR